MKKLWVALIGVPFICFLISFNVHLVLYSMITLDFSKVEIGKVIDNSMERVKSIFEDASKDIPEKLKALIDSMGISTEDTANDDSPLKQAMKSTKGVVPNPLAMTPPDASSGGGSGGGSGSPGQNSKTEVQGEESEKEDKNSGVDSGSKSGSLDAAKDLAGAIGGAGIKLAKEVSKVSSELFDQLDAIESKSTQKNIKPASSPEVKKEGLFNNFLDPQQVEVELVEVPKKAEQKEEISKDDVVIKKEEKKGFGGPCDPKNSYGGIGLQFSPLPVDKKGGTPMYSIEIVAPNQPADKAGILPGDLIVGDPLRFKGNIGTSVEVEVFRKGQRKVFNMVRAQICYSVVGGKQLQELEELLKSKDMLNKTKGP